MATPPGHLSHAADALEYLAPDELVPAVTTSANLLMTGPMLDVRREGRVWWATCPSCPGFSASASEWAELFRLVSEFHASDASKHQAWTMIQPFALIEDATGTVL